MANPKCRILCVDDHQDTSEMLELLLSQEDYEVVTALSMEEALELSKRESFDLYVLDKRLPDGTGLELCAQLNKLTPGVRCIFYTGDAYEIHRQEALRAGADAFVAKPDIDALIDAARELLANQECGTETKAMAK
jgi:two-component system, NtrC family, response regulator PilR